MRLPNPILGKYVNLRTAETSDAEFILSLRLDKELGRYIKKTDPSIEKQKIWIEQKQKKKNDYHMIIELKDTTRVGVIAVYDIKDGVFEWGRWIITPNSPFYISIESCYRAYDFAFNTLGLNITKSKIRKNNITVLGFHLNYGAKIIKEDDVYVYISYHKSNFISNSSFFQKYKEKLGLG